MFPTEQIRCYAASASVYSRESAKRIRHESEHYRKVAFVLCMLVKKKVRRAVLSQNYTLFIVCFRNIYSDAEMRFCSLTTLP